MYVPRYCFSYFQFNFSPLFLSAVLVWNALKNISKLKEDDQAGADQKSLDFRISSYSRINGSAIPVQRFFSNSLEQPSLLWAVFLLCHHYLAADKEHTYNKIIEQLPR